MKRTLYASAILSVAALAGCGGGGNSTASNAAGSTVGSTSLTGTVATGTAVSGASVTVMDALGKMVSVTADSAGVYHASLSGLSAPLAIFATDPAGLAAPLASVVAAIPTTTSSTTVANVTTLTTAAAALLTSSGNPLDLTDRASLNSLVTTASVKSAVQTLNSATAGILAANNLDATRFDPIQTPFSANQSGADAVLDAVQIVPAHGTSGGYQLISIGNANDAANLSLHVGATVASALPVPQVSLADIRTTIATLASCLLANATACTPVVDASYLENGFTSFALAHPALAAQGVTLGAPRVLNITTASDTSTHVLLALPYTTAGGAAGIEYTQLKLSGTSWRIVGNQQTFNVTIQSFIQRRQSPNFDYASQSPSYATPRYESGISVVIPLGAAGTPNPTTLASAAVTGPGISGTLYLVPPTSGSGKNTLSLAQAPQTTVPTGSLTSATQTQGYRWNWQSLPGVTTTYTPSTSNLGSKYAAQMVDVSTVPEYATYTVTFYDAGGNVLGQNSVTNTTPNYAAADGASIAWQTLSSDTLNGLLSARGAQAGALTSATLAWSNLVNGQNVAPLVTQAEVSSQYSPGGNLTATNVVGYWNGPARYAANGSYTTSVTAGVDQTGVSQCTSGCSFSAMAAGVSRNVDLFSSVGGVSADNHWDFSE